MSAGFRQTQKRERNLLSRFYHLIQLIFQPQIIRNHRDKFRIGRFSAVASLREGGGPLAVEGACVILKCEQISMPRILPQSLRASSLPEGALLVQLILEPQIVSYHRNELRIGRFFLTSKAFCVMLLVG